MGFDPLSIDLAREMSYATPFANSTLLLSLLMSLMKEQQRSPRTRDTFKNEYDYVIVGGGTAGSAVASRLSEEKCATVLLLEYGEYPPILNEMLPLAKTWWYTDLDYAFLTVPQKHTAYGLPGNRVPFPSGKVLGGTSVINGMMYVRGNHKNFDDWSDMGAEGWSYEEVLPYFRKLEDNNNPEYIKTRYHAAGGPVSASDQIYKSELLAPLIETVQQLGYKIVDSNGERQTGFYPEQTLSRKGQRCSAAKAYLVAAENRTNLDILLKAHVNKIIIEGEPGNLTAKKVVFDFGGEEHTVTARREVIMAAGSTITPQLLMLSGIGPKEELEKHDIKVLMDVPVGKNLIDHPLTFVDYFIDPKKLSQNTDPADENNIHEFINNRTGLLSSAYNTLLAFLKGSEIDPKEDFPTYELYLSKADVGLYKTNFHLDSKIYDSYYKEHENKPILHCVVQLIQPDSRGTITLNSTHPYDYPAIDPNYLAEPKDIQDLVDGLQVCQKIAKSQPIQSFLGLEPFKKPFPGCEGLEDDEKEYFKCLATYSIGTSSHNVGTTKMGDPRKSDTVVCPKLKVKGVRGLRVVDASIMPLVTSGNTATVVYMIAEKAADMIKEDLRRDMEEGNHMCSP